ncbi:hypothetical protein M569_13091 [Genlisea aurea]|uniref:Retrotransposon gag domain-containing protein n=1 Tax=Genlisea aurea TaxID=192259 RepID=S8DFW4_9LAMI|nr:hypothetical protein M569_13091 [Genlisea aurea]
MSTEGLMAELIAALAARIETVAQVTEKRFEELLKEVKALKTQKAPENGGQANGRQVAGDAMFDVLRTEEEEKVIVAFAHLDGAAQRWSLRCPSLAELCKLKLGNNLKEHNQRFDKLMSMIDGFSERHELELYLAGLTEKLAVESERLSAEGSQRKDSGKWRPEFFSLLRVYKLREGL